MEAKSKRVFEAGIEMASDFEAAMSALMSDLHSGAVSPKVGNAICNAGGKLLKSIELKYKFGVRRNGGTPALRLAEKLAKR